VLPAIPLAAPERTCSGNARRAEFDHRANRAAAAALFAAAGTIAIPGFWAYLAIFAVVMIVSFVALDPDLLRERMRPGGKKPPLALRIFSLVLFSRAPLHRMKEAAGSTG
jgi:hypothetical protein